MSETAEATTTEEGGGDLEAQINEQLAAAEAAAEAEATTEETTVETEAETQDNPFEGLREKLKTHFGADLGEKYKDDLEAARGLVNASSLVGQRDEDAQLGRLLRENPQAVLQQYQAHYQKAEQPDENDTPQWDERWPSMVEEDEAGNLKPKPGTDPTIPQKIYAFQNWAAQRQRDMLLNPEKVLEPLVERKAREIAERLVGEQIGQVRASSDANRWIEQNKDWLFSDGKIGNGNLSARGIQFNQHLQYAAQMGIPTMEGQIEFAMAKLGAAAAQTTAKPKPTPKTSHTSVSVPPPGKEGDLIHEGESFEQSVLRQLKDQGLLESA